MVVAQKGPQDFFLICLATEIPADRKLCQPEQIYGNVSHNTRILIRCLPKEVIFIHFKGVIKGLSLGIILA